MATREFAPPSFHRPHEIGVQTPTGLALVPTGTKVSTLLPASVDGALVIAALVDQKATSLAFPLSTSCAITPLTTVSPDGQRYYRSSQGLLLLEAAYRVDSSLDVRLSHSLGFAQRVVLTPSSTDPLSITLAKIEAEMTSLVQANIPLRTEWCTVNEAKEFFSARGWNDVVELLALSRAPLVELASYGSVFVPSPGPLAPTTGMIPGARLTVFMENLLLVFGPEGSRRQEPRGRISRQTSRHAAVAAATQTNAPTAGQEKWLSTVGIHSVGDFNAACVKGDVSQIIRVSEGFQEKRVGAIADSIGSLGDRLKVIVVAGPSSSGKTTFIKRLRVQLQVNGINPVGLSLDDYYCDRVRTPLDAHGQYDYESYDALRHDVLQEQLARLARGEEVHTARYDFPSGTSFPEGGRAIQIRSRDILMLEGIHGLNPELVGNLVPESVYRIFICPLTQLPFDRLSRVHVSDVRLLRRIIRDRHQRAIPAAENIARWPSVRAGELSHIFPFQENADAVFDSSLVYELAVLKVYAERYLLEIPPMHPSRPTALRLLELVDRFIAIYPDHVPPTSLLREFIGGSTFED